MKFCILLLAPLFLLPFCRLSAQQEPDPTQAALALNARLKQMTQTQFQQLLAKAQSGDAIAQYEVGLAYAEGRHVPKDSEEGGRWLLKSAEQGYAPAEGKYGMWVRGTNPAVAERWMLRAAEHGDAETQLWLGVAYEEDWFGTIDPELALKWYRKAAEGGEVDAQVVLGQKYEDGDGVEQDYTLAAKWFRKAAEHFPDLGGAGQGRSRLAQLYMQGLGVPRDYVQAYFWLELCGAGEANEAKAYLSPAQIEQGDKLVKAWQEEHRVGPDLSAAVN